jgi:glycosyltransferase involved in cell wall biosynthesis
LLREKAIGLGVDPATILLIQNGSDPGRPPQSRGEARKKIGLEGEDQLIGFVGGTFSQDARFMAEAFNTVAAQNNKVKLLLIGYFNREIENWLSDPSGVIRTGGLPYDRIFDYLSACDICWLPLCDNSANQGRWPLKFNDYLTVGRPVVATDVGGLKKVMVNHQVGLIAGKHSADFAQKTLELLEQSPLRENLGKNARIAAETVFSWERITRDLEMFYWRVLGKDAPN